MSLLPIPRQLLDQHIATLGKTGAGKSSVMRDIFEDLLDRDKRSCIVDPKGDWWGLKSSADGKGAGYPIICFGNFKEERATDVPINDRSGAEVAKLIATGNRPCIIGFRGWMPGAMTRFWIDFASTLFNANQGELYVGIDEVHNFAAKGKIMDPEAGKCLHWTNRILSEGRGLGLTFFIASQRAQKVHNDTLDCCETLIAMRVTHPAAREAIKDWIDGNGDPARGKEVLSTLAQLKRGEAWVWSPENDFGPRRVQFPMFRTFDSFAPPQLQKKVNQAGWSEVNLDQVREKLAAVIAEKEANDPRKLREKIAELQRELTKKTTSAAITEQKTTKVDPERDKKIAERAAKAATAPILKRLHEFQRRAQTVKAKLEAFSFDHIIGALHDIAVAELPPEPAAVETLPRAVSREIPVRPTIPAPAPSRPVQRVETNAPNNGNGSLSRPQLAMLQRLAEFRAIGRTEVNLAWLAASLSTTVRSRGFEENLRTVRASGYVLTNNQRAELTIAGLSLPGIQDVQPPTDVKGKICAMLSNPQAELFRVLDDDYPNSYTLEGLAERFGTTVRARGFEENIRFLRSNDLITVQGGQAKRAEWIPE